MPTLAYTPLFLNGSVIQLGCGFKATNLSDAIKEAKEAADKYNQICLLYEEIGRIQTASAGIKQISYKLKQKIAPKNNSVPEHLEVPPFFKWTCCRYDGVSWHVANDLSVWQPLGAWNKKQPEPIPDYKNSVIYSEIFDKINEELAHVHVQGDFELQLSFKEYNPLLMPTIYRVAKVWCKKWNRLRSQFQNKHEVRYHKMEEEVHFTFTADDDEYDNPHLSMADDGEITVDDLPEEDSSSEEE